MQTFGFGRFLEVSNLWGVGLLAVNYSYPDALKNDFESSNIRESLKSLTKYKVEEKDLGYYAYEI